MTPTTPAINTKATPTTGLRPRKRTGRGLLAKATAHFAAHPGEHITLGDLVVLLGATEAQTKACMADALNRNKLPGLEPIVRGNVWVYKPNGRPEKRLLEEVGEAKDGTLILQDEDGHLWAAKPLEVS